MLVVYVLATICYFNLFIVILGFLTIQQITKLQINCSHCSWYMRKVRKALLPRTKVLVDFTSRDVIPNFQHHVHYILYGKSVIFIQKLKRFLAVFLVHMISMYIGCLKKKSVFMLVENYCVHSKNPYNLLLTSLKLLFH